MDVELAMDGSFLISSILVEQGQDVKRKILKDANKHKLFFFDITMDGDV